MAGLIVRLSPGADPSMKVIWDIGRMMLCDVTGPMVWEPHPIDRDGIQVLEGRGEISVINKPFEDMSQGAIILALMYQSPSEPCS